MSIEAEAIALVKAVLAKPMADDPHTISVDDFDPWEIFPCVYGSYSSDFDDMAIQVLENIRDGRFGASAGEGLAHEMFREMLCTSGLCDYGTSPRGCFPNWGSGFEDVLPALIEKWKEWRALVVGHSEIAARFL